MNAADPELAERDGHRHLLVIGGQRCGTTWLGNVLATHPDVRIPHVTRPEPKYFLTGEEHERYDALFPATGGRWLVDKSTTYLERADAAVRALRCVPDAAVVAVVRDPVERAHSNWRFTVANGLEDLSFAESLTDEAQRRRHPGLSTSPYDTVRRGRYVELLAPWKAAFATRLVVLQYEQMVAASGAAYLVERLAAVGFRATPDWPTTLPPVNAAPGVGGVPEAERELLRSVYDGVNDALAMDGVDLSLWGISGSPR